MSSGKQSKRRTLTLLESVLWVCAAASILPLLAAWGGRSYIERELDESPASRQHVSTTSAAISPQLSPPAVTVPVAVGAEVLQPGNTTYWSSTRLGAFERLRASFAPPPIRAVLVLPRQDVRIPVFSGVTEVSMTLGAGHLQDTAPLDGEGNIAVTAHRDGSFRVLKDIALGDPMVLQVNGEDRFFTVTRRSIVTPDRVDVLDPTPATTLTLITCYPFYFVGKAPQRFVLQAELRPAGTPITGLAAEEPTRAYSEHALHAPN